MAAFGGTNKEPYVIVVGGTGHGKSTFINALANFFLKGSLDNIKVAIKTKYFKGNLGLKDTETGSDKPMVSQTNECTAYRFTHPVTKQVFNLIDTPGLSDTRGVATDDLNVDRVIKAAELCPHLSAMVLIVNGTQPRFTIDMQNIFTRLRGILPDVILQNVIVVFTNTWEHSRNFNIDSLRFLHDKEGDKKKGKDGKEIVLLPVRNDHIFHLDNTAFSSDPRDWDCRVRRRLQTDWDDCNDEIQAILNLITSMSTHSSSVFTEMRASRDQIKSALAQAKLDIVKLQEIQDKIDESKAQLGRFANDVEQFKNYKHTTTVKTTEMVDVGYHSTMCSSCNHVCHDHCGLDEITTQGSNQFMQCSAFSGSQCSVCPNKCSYTVHFHDSKTMREVEKTLETELEDMKQKYLAAQQGSAQSQQDLDTHAAAEQAIDDAITACTQKVEASCHALKKLCSGFNFVDELAITIQQLEFEARSLRSLKARDSADKIIRMLKALVDKLNIEDSRTGLAVPAGGWGAARSSSSSSSSSSGYSSSSSSGSSSSSSSGSSSSSSSGYSSSSSSGSSSSSFSSRQSATVQPSPSQSVVTSSAALGSQLICQQAGCSQLGKPVSGRYCSECGKEAALPAAQPVCRTSGCDHNGKIVVGRFCSQCGKAPALPTTQPVCRTSDCEKIGQLVSGRFCSQCGSPPS